jgi:hypothetical protein
MLSGVLCAPHGGGHGEQGAHREVVQRVRQRLGVLGEPAQQVLDLRVVQVRRARLRLYLCQRGRGAYGRRARAHRLHPMRLWLRDEVLVAVLPAQMLQALGVPQYEPLRLRLRKLDLLARSNPHKHPSSRTEHDPRLAHETQQA